jgi:hypothetical protein
MADPVRDACEACFDANKSDCSGFVRAVGTTLGVAIAGLADDIVNTLRAGGAWAPLKGGPAAAASAAAGNLVVGGLLGNEQAAPSEHGHVVVVVAGPLNRGLYPSAYWGRLGGVGAKNETVNWAWNAADRDKVTYAAHTL